MTIPALIPSSAVEINSGRPVTTSLAVAEIFEKRHDNVLQSIDEMECSPGFRALNFQESFRETPTGNGAVRRFRTVEMTKDGFTILAMGYTGAKAMAFNGGALGRAAPRSGTANPVASATQFVLQRLGGGSQAYSRIVL